MMSGTGVANAKRMMAAITDNLLAIVLSVLVNGILPMNDNTTSLVVISAVYLGYFVIFESLWAKTPGKMFTGLTIRKIDGTQPGLKEALLRTALRLFEVNPLLAGGLPAGLSIMLTKRKQRLGDLIAGTIVVPGKAR